MEKKLTHYDRVLRHLQDFDSINQVEAINEYGNYRLSATIFLLRKDYPIVSIHKTGKNRYGEKTNYVDYMLEEKYLKRLNND